MFLLPSSPRLAKPKPPGVMVFSKARRGNSETRVREKQKRNPPPYKTQSFQPRKQKPRFGSSNLCLLEEGSLRYILRRASFKARGAGTKSPRGVYPRAARLYGHVKPRKIECVRMLCHGPRGQQGALHSCYHRVSFPCSRIVRCSAMSQLEQIELDDACLAYGKFLWIRNEVSLKLLPDSATKEFRHINDSLLWTGVCNNRTRPH